MPELSTWFCGTRQTDFRLHYSLIWEATGALEFSRESTIPRIGYGFFVAVLIFSKLCSNGNWNSDMYKNSMIAAAFVFGAVTVIAGSTSAMDVKWLSCQYYDSVKGLIVRPNSVFALGGTVNVDKQYDAFLQAAKNQGKLDETSKTEGTCVLSNSEDEALQGQDAFVKHFKGMGAKTASVGFAPN